MYLPLENVKWLQPINYGSFIHRLHFICGVTWKTDNREILFQWWSAASIIILASKWRTEKILVAFRTLYSIGACSDNLLPKSGQITNRIMDRRCLTPVSRTFKHGYLQPEQLYSPKAISRHQRSRHNFHLVQSTVNRIKSKVAFVSFKQLRRAQRPAKCRTSPSPRNCVQQKYKLLKEH